MTEKADVVEHFMMHFNPRLDIKNREGLNPMEVSKSTDVITVFFKSIQRMKDEIERKQAKKQNALKDITNLHYRQAEMCKPMEIKNN